MSHQCCNPVTGFYVAILSHALMNHKCYNHFVKQKLTEQMQAAIHFVKQKLTEQMQAAIQDLLHSTVCNHTDSSSAARTHRGHRHLMLVCFLAVPPTHGAP
jgi:ABC-type molybdenum transport system ATPase subunit/photorepair protein PhrA